MTSHTLERPAMTERAGGLVQSELAGAVAIHEVLHVAGWFEIGFLRMAIPTG